MQRMMRFWRGLRLRNQIFLVTVSALLFLFFFFVVSIEAVHYTESTEFCSTCHAVMEPEIVTHQLSAHAEVDCGACHVGEGIEHKLYYKATAIRYLWTLPLQLYDRPLASARDTMRSTDEICGSCHSLDHEHPSKLIVDNDYGLDDENSLTQLLLAMKVEEDGDELAARSTGPHWHVNHPVSFIATDDFRQDIPWVQVEKDGELIEYVEAGADPNIWEEGEAEILTMDCIDCHSREGHSVQRPAEAIDRAMASSEIPADLPAVKRIGMAVLDEQYESDEMALEAIATSVRDFYQNEFPNVADERSAQIDRTVDELQEIFDYTQFPHMRVYWDTYPENTGHKDFPGCFRCHAGNQLNDDGEAISASCTLCHAVPQIIRPDEPLQLTSVSIANAAPESHRSSLWIAEHRFQFDTSCMDCHTINDPGGTSNTSSCSNSGCHAMDWSYLEIDSSEVLTLVVPERRDSVSRLPRIPHPLPEMIDCQICHGAEKVFAYPEDHQEYEQDQCTDCHQLSQDVLDNSPIQSSTDAPAPVETSIPLVNHPVEGNEDCLACHAVDGNIQPAPITHNDFTNEVCGDCHQLAPNVIPLSELLATATPMPTPTAEPTATATTEPTATPEPTAGVDDDSSAESEQSDNEADDAQDADVQAGESGEPEAAEGESTSVDESLLIVSHSIAGNENCVACHAVDSPIDPAPQSHVIYTNDTCQECHQAASE